MRLFKRSAIDFPIVRSDWAQRLLRFICLYVGNHPLAESLTIELLTQADCLRDRHSACGLPVALIRRAIILAVRAPEASTLLDDRVVQAVKSLPTAQRVIIALFRGLGLSLEEVADVTDSRLAETKRICADALLAIHRFVTAPSRTTVERRDPNWSVPVRKLNKFFFVFLVASTSPLVWSQQSAPLTLDQALARARTRAPQILVAQQRIDEARGRLAGASVRQQENPHHWFIAYLVFAHCND